MCSSYGPQFGKMMTLLAERFLPVLQEVTSTGGEAGLVSLKMLLANYFAKKTFQPPPEGYRSLL